MYIWREVDFKDNQGIFHFIKELCLAYVCPCCVFKWFWKNLCFDNVLLTPASHSHTGFLESETLVVIY